MNARPDTFKAFTDAAADAVAREIAALRREAQRERELRDAEHRARLAELDARIARADELERRLADRVASVRDGEPGRDGADGTSVTVEEVAPLIEDAVRRAVAEIPAPKDGRDGADGKDGKDVDPEAVRQMVDEAVSRIPAPKDGRDGADGTSVTVEEVAPLVEDAVRRAVAEIPAPKDGRDGADGKDGKDGKLPVVKAWTDRVHYEGEVVSHAGATWQAGRDTGREPPHADWTCLAAAGRDGRSFTVRGTWSKDETYGALDVVALNGASFAARRDDPGQCPGEGWQLIAAQGRQGKPGEKGPLGVKGLPGEPVRELSINGDGLLTLVNGDGSKVECDLYPLLSKL